MKVGDKFFNTSSLCEYQIIAYHENLSSGCSVGLLEIKTGLIIGRYKVNNVGDITKDEFAELGWNVFKSEDEFAYTSNGRPIFEKPKLTFQLGNVFRCDGDEYILAQVDHWTFSLIGLRDGNRWTAPVKFKKEDIQGNRITEDQFSLLCGSAAPSAFKLVRDHA